MKRIITIFCFIVLIICLTGCTPIVHERNMQMVTASSGLYAQQYAGGPAAGIYLESTTENATKVLVFDYQNNTIDYLREENEPIEFQDIIGGIYPFSAFGSFFLIKNGYPANLSKSDPGYSSYIIQLDELGNTVAKFTLGNHQMFEGCAIATDGANLYTIIQDYDTADGTLIRRSIARIDVISGQMELLYTLQNDHYSAIVGVYEQGIVLETYTPLDEQESEMQMEVLLFSLETNKTHRTDIRWKSGTRSRTIYDGQYYYIDSEDMSLRSIHLMSGDSETLRNNLGGFFDVPATSISIVGDMTDGKITMEVISNGSVQYFFYDVEDHFGKKLSLSFEDREGNAYVPSIVSTTPTHYVIETGEYEKTVQFEIDGNMLETETLIPQYSLIPINDYWDSNSDTIIYVESNTKHN